MESDEKENMGYILGIDQGRTHTRAAVSDRFGNILAVAKSAGACHAYEGLERAMNTVLEASEKALSQSKVHLDQIDVLFAGLTGADWPEEYDLLKNGLQQLPLCFINIHVVNDAIIAMRAGTQQPYGVILIAGTMGNCAIRSPYGEEFIYQYYCEPDLQGGVALGTRALNTIFRSYTGREPDTLLTDLVLRHYALNTVDELCKRYYANKLGSISELAPLVFKAAASGDDPASFIIKSFAEGYAEMAIAGLRRMHMLDMDVEIVLSGSIFTSRGKLLYDTIRTTIHAAAPKAQLVNAHYEPLVGSVMLGLESVGVSIGEQVLSNLEQSAKRFKLERHPSRRLIG